MKLRLAAELTLDWGEDPDEREFLLHLLRETPLALFSGEIGDELGEVTVQEVAVVEPEVPQDGSEGQTETPGRPRTPGGTS